MPLRSRSMLLGGLVLVAALAWVAWCLHAYRDFVHDDAYITLRYVRNLLAGDGLVWNPGERVEGYTSFGAVLAIALPGLLGIDLLFTQTFAQLPGHIAGNRRLGQAGGL